MKPFVVLLVVAFAVWKLRRTLFGPAGRWFTASGVLLAATVVLLLVCGEETHVRRAAPGPGVLALLAAAGAFAGAVACFRRGWRVRYGADWQPRAAWQVIGLTAVGAVGAAVGACLLLFALLGDLPGGAFALIVGLQTPVVAVVLLATQFAALRRRTGGVAVAPGPTALRSTLADPVLPDALFAAPGRRARAALVAGWVAIVFLVYANSGQRFGGRDWPVMGMLCVLWAFFVGWCLLCARFGRVFRSHLVSKSAAAVPAPAPPPAPKPVPPAAAGPKVCRQCGGTVAADAPLGVCPRCLMRAALASQAVDENRTSPYRGPLTPPDPTEVQEFFPNLNVLGLIGAGGMGAVYKVRQPGLDRVVALKLIRPREDDPTFAERFAREAKAMARLSHPNIVSVHETGESGGTMYLLMEFVDGVTLRDAMKAKALTPAQALAVVGQVCGALQYAHECGVVHRDIKPENILLDKAGKVKIADFGLAKVADADAVSLTRTHQAMGTPHYMAPEQWERPAEVDHRADMFALGVVIYELLTGELPLGRFDPPSKTVGVDGRLDEVVLRLLQKDPGRRYQHASDVRTALEYIGRHPGRAPRRSGGGWEYTSKATVWGWPLVHVATGVDPDTGRPRWARGVIAVGSGGAVGGVAVSGGLSVGVVAVGSLAWGVVATGAGAVGVLAVGGVALGLAGAAGGAAVAGLIAVGGAAVGYFAMGGAAFGRHVLNGNTRDPQAFWDAIGNFFSTVGDPVRQFFTGG